MESIDQKKICFVTHLPNLTGANQSLLDILDGIDRQAYKPIVLLGKRGLLAAELENRNIDYRIMGYSSEIKEKNFFVNLIKIIKSRLAVYKIGRFLKKEKIDIVHNNSLLVWAGMEAARRSGVKYICHVRELVWEDHHIRLLHEKAQYTLMENADMTIFISEFVKNTFIKKHNIKNYITIKDGICIERYLNEKHIGLFENMPIKIVMAGRVASGKRQMDAVKAVGYLKNNGKCDCNLLVVGSVADQQYFDELKEYVKENQLEDCITFQAFCDLKEIRAASDIALMCSVAEGLGRVTVESMLSGCIVIGADAGATPEIITDGENGYLYNAGDFLDLARVIEWAVQNKDRAEIIQQKAKERCLKEFDLSQYVAMIEKEYEKVFCCKGEKGEIFYK